MKRFNLLFLALTILTNCKKQEKSFELRTIQIKDKLLYVELATTPIEWSKGLQGRSYLPDSQGMLFIFPYSDTLSFWMKETPLPLSLAYIDSTGIIKEIHDLIPFDETPVVSKDKVQFALEVNRGWFEKNGIKIGDTVMIGFLR